MIAVTHESSSLVEAVLGSLSTLVAAFLGAWFAFGLQRRKQAKELKEANVVSINLAAFTFIRACNSLQNIKAQIISTHESNRARHHFIKPVLPDSLQKIQINYTSLAFLLRADPNLMMEVTLVEQDVNGTIEVIRERSRLHYEHLQPAVEHMQRTGQETVTPQEVDAAMGPRNAQQLKIATDYMVDGVNRGIESTRKIVRSLGDAGRKEYPGEKFICVS